ncbi:DExH-box ATP-dependent RNA helicase DExH10 [Zea mays]|uniref:DExH-box ATP-dependent RNA helicase DExH10 n=1 Tax=Zea mays TaxID=4577 RepID=A0A1D6FFE6_MAIZE|nr:DExH-box ATP-dependent RNA helicase DExH10 [Zea mays]
MGEEAESNCKRKAPDSSVEEQPSLAPAPAQSQADPAAKRPNISRSCVHEVAVPNGYESVKDEAVHGTLASPAFNGEMAKQYPFKLDPFQSVSIACLERNESVLVSAHTSAGKTVVAEYAIAMAFRDKQRVIYTSPLKALSNQKYRELSQEFTDVGLMTGDVTLHPNATCLVMTTEILRAMLYRGSEVIKEVAWVIFDEIHYMKDRERGVVWEESIIFLPPAIKMVFLSATMSNATEFAEWICSLHKQPCHVVYTDFRPTPLQHYMFPIGGSGLYLVVDENGQFREDNFAKLQDSFAKPNNQLDGRKGGGPKASGRIAKGGSASGNSDIYRIVKMIMERKFQPVIIFSFSRRECEHHAMSMSKLDFSTEEEKECIEQVFCNAIGCLVEEDRSLPAIELMLPLLKRGIAVHHSGLLPIIKELVELLFQEGLVKALFATETFAMGLNMPAKTVVFTSVKKWDGDSNRYIGSGEYIQMEMSVIKDMVLGKPAPLVSTFRLSYYTILNLMSRVEGQFTAEHVIRHSFHEFQYEKALPEIAQKITRLENEATLLDSSGETDLAEYHKLGLDISELEKKIMSEMIRPERALLYLVPGRLVRVRDGSTDWGWGVVVNVVKKPPASGTLPPALSASRSNNYTVDTLLHCSSNSSENGSRSKPCPPRPGEKGEMHVVPVPLPLVSGLSSVRINIPPDLRPPEARQNILSAVQELGKRYPQGLPKLHPINDMGIQEPELVDLVHKLEDLEQKQCSHRLHKVHLMILTIIKLPPLLAALYLVINQVQRECKLEVNVEEYVESTCRPYLMDVIYCWSRVNAILDYWKGWCDFINFMLIVCVIFIQGATFAEVMEMTDIFEGSVIRLARRLDEFLNQLRAAAEAVGEVNLEKKFKNASESLRRGIMFSNSLYL